MQFYYSNITLLSIGNYLKRYLYFGNLQGIHQRELNTKGLNPNLCNLAKVKFSNLIEDKKCFPKKQNTSKKKILLLGDSHSNMFKNSLIKLKKKIITLLILLEIIVVSKELENHNYINDLCYQNMKSIDSWIREKYE